MTRDTYGKAFVERYDQTRRVLVKWGLGTMSADDIAQDAVPRGWERISQRRYSGAVGSWVNSIALNMMRGRGAPDAVW